MKAALTHLEYPEAKILFTFYTKSMYQHIRRLITRFYRQFDDMDPDFERIRIIHAWGGRNNAGVYYETCLAHKIDPRTYPDAARNRGSKQAFDFVCTEFESEVTDIKPMYDYTFIDEGQDFPASFIRICSKITSMERVVWAYDDLQTIFQLSAPSPAEIFGVDSSGKAKTEIKEDLVLYKCYRNPREILVCAHALGFGLYGPRIVQLLENEGHWNDIGYNVISGEFKEGQQVVIERPVENSLPIVSEYSDLGEIIQAHAFEKFDEEISYVCQQIEHNIKEGLRPDDILVISVDDRSAKSYLSRVAGCLAALGIQTHNVHADSYGINDFNKDDFVTLSTVHKAKGNESYMVYIVGSDALFTTLSGVKDRNMIFTALTRAKGWVRVSGIGEAAKQCKLEIETALGHFPNLCFRYPGEQEIKIMKRDLEDKDIHKQKAERLLDQLTSEMSKDEIMKYLEQRQIKKK